jgi:hypothetical protein
MRACLSLALVASWTALPSRAAEPPIDYLRDIKPVLAEKCYSCHGALKQKADLRVDTVRAMLEGGANGATIVPGKSSESLLVARVLGQGGHRRMPPPGEGEAFNERQLALLRAWIDQGAKGPNDEKPEADPREHWAFQAPVKAPLPGKEAHPIDAFLADKWNKLGLTPQPMADRRLLLRRVSLDLIGLPPTPEEQDAFLKDTSPNAYEKVVDRLLKSPHYGERWGRHWMDIWRYSDWWGLGQEVRNSQKHIWHWRDWIVESLNDDKGYDQMLREMFAADELYPNDLARLRATGFLVRQYFKFNRTTWLDDAIEHTSKAFMGLTLNCCKCHAHKYDPFTQEDFYHFRAFYEPYQIRTEQVPGELSYEKNGIPRVYDSGLETPTYLFVRGEERMPVKDRPLAPGLPKLLTWDTLDIKPVVLPPEAAQPGLRPHVLENYLKAAKQQIEAAQKAVEKARKDFDNLAKDSESKRTGGATPTELSVATGKLLWKSDFAGPEPEVWETLGGQWKHSKGRLVQETPGVIRSLLKAKQAVPADFEATLAFRLTGGTPYQSVGMLFDLGDEHEVLVYATGQGQRVSVAFKEKGMTHVYPKEGVAAVPVPMDETFVLTTRVQGRLLNIEANGKPLLAYRLPIERKPGGFALLTFAATAEFESFALRALADGIKLSEPSERVLGVQPAAAPRPLDPKVARASLVHAEKALSAAQMLPALYEAQAAADRAKYQTPPASNFADLAKTASRLEKEVAVAKAEETLAKAELDVLQPGPLAAKKIDPIKARDAAKDALAKARKDLASPGDQYTSLRGAIKTPSSNLESGEALLRPFPTQSTGRRSALAAWLTDRRNPLTARVAVNHIWGRHFGKPLVATVFDFGRKGATPTHPELLDYLAVDLMDNGWSMKRLHRLIVTSRAYRLTSSTTQAAAKNLELDAENKYLWRMNPLRMEAQVVRDSLLHLAGELDTTLGGPSIPVTDDASRRRSLYFVHSHNDSHKFLAMFDDANVRECYRRSESIVPQQALTLANSKLALTMAELMNQQLHKRLGKVSDDVFVRVAFEWILGTSPSREEIEECLLTLSELRDVLKGQANMEFRARGDIVHALVNHNDFITIR